MPDAPEGPTLIDCALSACSTVDILTRAERHWQSGDISGGILLAEEAMRGECERCGQECRVEASMLLVLFLAAISRNESAQLLHNRLMSSPAVQADPRHVASATLVSARLALLAGDHLGAAELAERGLRLSEEIGRTMWTSIGNLVLATTTLRRGDLSAAIRYGGHLEDDAVFAREVSPVGQSAWAIVQIAQAARGDDKAAELAAELLESETFTRRLLVSEPAAVPWLVRLLIKLGARTPAVGGVRFARRLAAENPDVLSVRAAALHAAALVDGDLDQLLRAADMHVDPWARASAVEDVGILVCAGRAESPDAAQYFEQAMRGYTKMGSLRDSSRVMSRMRRINVTPTSTERFRPRSGVPGLTDTEYAVAKLVSRGMTNSQTAELMFLSRHTVAFHLRKVFQKIGIKSRLELAVIWNELDTGSADHDTPA